MFLFSENIYQELAYETATQMSENPFDTTGVVELIYGKYELIFGFDYCEHSLNRWMIITFEGGRRCESDFEIEIMKEWLQNTINK